MQTPSTMERRVVPATLAEALARLREFVVSSERGRCFGVTFVKRTNGEIRNMVAVFRGTRRHLAHGDQAYCFAEKGLLPVADMEIAQQIAVLEKRGLSTEEAIAQVGKPFRTIPKEAIRRLTIDGVEYAIEAH